MTNYALGLVVSATAPTAPDTGDLWFDTTTGLTKQWSGTAWTKHDHGSLRATSVVAESMPRNYPVGNQVDLYSGFQTLQLVWYDAGTVVTDITFISWGTAAVTPTNQWFSLYSLARAKLAVTADATTAAWAAYTAKTFALTAPYTIPTSGYYYHGIMVKAATVVSLAGTAHAAAVTGLAPISCGYDGVNSGLTTPASAPATAGALSAANGNLYTYAR